jgi:carbon-monoxide dehydrogenase medium subunit
VIPLALSYTKATSLNEALRAISDGAKPIAGGQSLGPMMRLRLASPDGLVDLGGIAELTGIRREGGELVIGAMTRHRDVANSADVQGAARAVAQAAAGIGSPAVRNRGTIGGSLANADPAADWPAVVVALQAEVEIVGPNGLRRVAARDFFVDIFSTALAPDEILTGIRIPRPKPGMRFIYRKIRHPASGFAVVGIAVVSMRNSNRSRAPSGSVVSSHRLTPF